jgi:hypothetical protein
LARDRVTLGDFDPPNDKLDAAERGLEWGAALLKARATVRRISGSRTTGSDGRNVVQPQPDKSVVETPAASALHDHESGKRSSGG